MKAEDGVQAAMSKRLQEQESLEMNKSYLDGFRSRRRGFRTLWSQWLECTLRCLLPGGFQRFWSLGSAQEKVQNVIMNQRKQFGKALADTSSSMCGPAAAKAMACSIGRGVVFVLATSCVELWPRRVAELGHKERA